MTRVNTRLACEGSKSLALGNLLIRGVSARKPDLDNVDYDLISENLGDDRPARIRVTTRWRTGAQGFICKKFEFDFLVIAFLNRGTKDGTGKIGEPQLYVVPVDLIQHIPGAQEGRKIYPSTILRFQDYLEAWDLIRTFTSRDHNALL